MSRMVAIIMVVLVLALPLSAQTEQSASLDRLDTLQMDLIAVKLSLEKIIKDIENLHEMNFQARRASFEVNTTLLLLLFEKQIITPQEWEEMKGKVKFKDERKR